MIRVASNNIKSVLNKIDRNLVDLSADDGPIKDKALRIGALSAVVLLRERVHVEGKKTDGQNIGNYTTSYIKFRQEKWNRTADKKKIMSLTRQMENDLSLTGDDPIKTSTGYAIGFKNEFNAKKADWLQNGKTSYTVKEYTMKRKGKELKIKSHTRDAFKGYGKVYKLNDEEKKKIIDAVNEEVKKMLDNM